MKTTVVVSMIVKNESKIIKRCLDSIKNALPGVNLIMSISDTGSTDGTDKIIKKWGEINNVQTFVHTWTVLLKSKAHHMTTEDIETRYNVKIKGTDIFDIHWYMGIRSDERMSFQDYQDHPLEKEFLPHLTIPVYLVSHKGNDYHMNSSELLSFLNSLSPKNEYVESEHFVNFGFNRNRNLTRTKEIIDECKFDVNNTFILLCDADMVLTTRSFNFSELDDSSVWEIIQHNKNIKYHNIRLLRATDTGSYNFKTHEYYKTSGKIGVLNENRIWYEDKPDGGSKQIKAERDEEMLLTEIECQRKYYYLGSCQKDISNRCLRNSQQALLKTTQETLLKLSQSYKRKASESFSKASTYTTYVDETMWSFLKLADIRLTDGPVDESEMGRQIVLYTKASYYRPDRAEPHYYLARYLRSLDNKLTKGVMSIAYHSALKALEILKTRPQHGLFVDISCNIDSIHYELSIISFYANDFVQGLKSCDHLLSNEVTRVKAYKDSVYYSTKLKPIKKTSNYKSMSTPKVSYYTPIIIKQGVALCRHHDNYYRIFSSNSSSLIFKLQTEPEKIKIVRTSETNVNIFAGDESGSIDLIVSH